MGIRGQSSSSPARSTSSPARIRSYVGGFFFSRDLFPKTATAGVDACATSNVAEMFYLLVPDPDGVVNQNVRSTDFVRTVTAGILAHEFQHLINASRHLYVNTGNSTFEESFLDEGLAHMAEELAFYRASGLAPRQNISAATVQSSQRISDAFDTFGSANIRRYREFLISALEQLAVCQQLQYHDARRDLVLSSLRGG